MIKFWFAQLYVCGMESSIFCWNYSWGVKTLGNGWSKSFFLEDKVVLNFDFKLGAKKTGHFDRPLWTNIFQYISIYFTRSWFTLFHHQQDKNKSERPVVALAVKKYQLLTHWLTDSLTTSNQEMQAHLKVLSIMIGIGIFPAFGLNGTERRNPLKKCFFQKMWFFGDLGFPSVILVNKPLKALCLSFKMVYQHLLYLLSLCIYWHLKNTQGPTRFLQWEF